MSVKPFLQLEVGTVHQKRDGKHTSVTGAGVTQQRFIGSLFAEPKCESYNLISAVYFALPPLPMVLTPSTMNFSNACPSLLFKAAETQVDVVVGVVTGALAIAALGFVLLRRQAMNKKDVDPPPPEIDGGDNLEHGRREHEQRPGVSNHPTPSVVVGGDEVSGLQPQQQPSSSPQWYAPTMHQQRNILPPTHHQHAAVAAADADAVDTCEIAQSLSPAPLVGAVLCGFDAAIACSGGDGVSSLAGVGAAEDGSTDQLLLLPTTTTTSTANGSTGESAKLEDGVRTPTRDDVVSLPDAPASGESGKPSTAGGRRTSGDLGYGQAVMAAAEELAQHCQTPGVSEAATMVSILIHLVSDSRDEMNRSDASVKRCRSIVVMLERAAKVVGKVCLLCVTRMCRVFLISRGEYWIRSICYFGTTGYLLLRKQHGLGLSSSLSKRSLHFVVFSNSRAIEPHQSERRRVNSRLLVFEFLSLSLSRTLVLFGF